MIIFVVISRQKVQIFFIVKGFFINFRNTQLFFFSKGLLCFFRMLQPVFSYLRIFINIGKIMFDLSIIIFDGLFFAGKNQIFHIAYNIMNTQKKPYKKNKSYCKTDLKQYFRVVNILFFVHTPILNN